MQWARAVPLIAVLLRQLEAEQVEDLLHANVAAKAVEVDSRHVYSLCNRTREVGHFGRRQQDRSVPFLYKGNGNAACGRWRGFLDALPTVGRAADSTGAFQRLQSLAEAFVLDGQGFAELGSCNPLALG